mmetsp:Transcript_83/g.160  ORF Transcript_83/g.160 Transcript_83/m.160 type:complete len:225 (+) Transcript_83:1044-1718(+)
MVAEALSLERVGHVFTTLNKDKVFMTSSQLRQAAALQQQHIVNHPDGYKVSKFVTVVVQAEDPDKHQIGVECYMASDQCQALERDSVLGESGDPKKMKIREPGHEEAMPAVLQEGAPVKEFDPDFFLVSLAHGQPNQNNVKFNIIKRYDFPCMHRFGQNPQNKDFKSYMQATKPMKNSFERFANFHLLLYLSELLDLQTAVGIAQCVANEIPIENHIIDWLEQI